MIKTLRNKKGVTLVELLAVIVIMGIIAAIAVPAIGGLISRQKDNAALQSANNVIEAVRLYATENTTDSPVTVSELITAGYLSSNPFSTTLAGGTGNDLSFAYTSAGVVSSITAPTAEIYVSGVRIYISGISFTLTAPSEG